MSASRIIALVLSLVIPIGVGTPQPITRSAEKSDRTWVEETLRQMTLEEKVGQMFIPALAPIFMNQESEDFGIIVRNIAEFHVGGYHVFGGDPIALAALLNRMQRVARIPLLITADLEGGPGYQFRGATRLPRAMALGATGSEELAYRAGQITAREGRALGIHVNFYPVLDVNNNPRNPIINIRSFGEDVALVSRLGRAYIRGAQENGQLATAKHFPGHGDTSQDSHLELPLIRAGRERLEQVELPPFREAIRAGVGVVMTAHIALPEVDPEGLPATLSPRILTGLLRTELGFEGLIVTDAMDMRGITNHFSVEDATVRAVRAGADLILFPPDVEKAVRALREAVRRGDIALERIEASVKRILEAKARLGLHRNRYVDLGQIEVVVGNRDHTRWAQEMIERALTLIRDDRRWIPWRPEPGQRLLLLTILDAREGWREGMPGRTFREELMRRHPNTIEVVVDERTSRETIEVIKKLADLCDVVLVNAFIRVAAYKGTIDLTEEQRDLLRALSRRQMPVFFTLFGSPYGVTSVPEMPTAILTYEYYPEAERAALRAILGEIPFRGRLPISLPGAYPLGHGLMTTARSPQSINGSVGISPRATTP